MNWAEREFYDEVRYRKSLANAARHVKNGSRTKYVSLPSDGMSQAEWKRRNGEVSSYNLNRAVLWKEFKYWPNDVKAMYLNGLQDKFNVSMLEVSKMFGIKASTLSQYLSRNGIEVQKLGRMTNAERRRFEAFVAGVVDEQEVEAEPEPIKSEVPKTAPTFVTRLGGSLSLMGNVSAVMESAYQAMGNGQVKVNISWEYV